MPETFKMRLSRKINDKKTFLCLGVDPMPSLFPGDIAQTMTSEKWGQWLETILDIGSAKVAAVKFQSAYFEAMGIEGIKLLHQAVSTARKKSILTLIDCKRGDISSTMRAYGDAVFDAMKADAMTVTPYLGTDVLSPLDLWLEQGKGVYVVCLGSNPSANELLSLSAGSGMPFHEHVFSSVSKRMRSVNLCDSVGFVYGATKIKNLSKSTTDQIRPQMLLLPGVGAQGAKMSDLDCLFNASSAHLVPVSRGLTAWDFINKDGKHFSWSTYYEALSTELAQKAHSLSFYLNPSSEE